MGVVKNSASHSMQSLNSDHESEHPDGGYRYSTITMHAERQYVGMCPFFSASTKDQNSRSLSVSGGRTKMGKVKGTPEARLARQISGGRVLQTTR
jgi:hypothetical protein